MTHLIGILRMLHRIRISSTELETEKKNFLQCFFPVVQTCLPVVMYNVQWMGNASNSLQWHHTLAPESRVDRAQSPRSAAKPILSSSVFFSFSSWPTSCKTNCLTFHFFWFLFCKLGINNTLLRGLYWEHYSHHAIHFISRTYLCFNWSPVPFNHISISSLSSPW